MNKENYKKAVNQIHANEELKNKTISKILDKKKPKFVQFKKFLAACAVVAIVFSGLAIYLDENKEEETNFQEKIAKTENNLPRFESMDELKKVVKNNYSSLTKSDMSLDIATNAVEETEAESEANYSTTNIQVENVDEADIVKTDGDYIYYVSNKKVYIIKSDTLKIVSTIESKDDNFSPTEIYINEDKIIILGYTYSIQTEQTANEEDIIVDVAYSSQQAKAIVYDISDKKNPHQSREVGLDGTYKDSRMIGDNIYFISVKSIYYYTGMKDEDLLPIVEDTAISEGSKTIDCTDIAYFGESSNSSYMIVAGFNINNEEEVNIETFYGVGNTVYSSKENLYIAQEKYDYTNKEVRYTTTIYKFNLEDSNISLQCKGEIDGDVNDQFSIDEYDGNLRIATTAWEDGDTINELYVLDENLNIIGKIEDMAKGEEIYSVRFIGAVGYVVTFEEIDPLFVIDLSDPTNPTIEGELKIPGYSSYLHPYDENHVIGIGYNTKSNGYDGVTNYNMKMTMFDVSDLENPKELFSVDIGDGYTYSEITYNHKALFYNDTENLIGFPITYNSINELVIYKIDLEEGFIKYGAISQNYDYTTQIERAIYIEDIVYVLEPSLITAYDLSSLEKIKTLELD